jgi:phosphatidylinositol alpha-1,6-mannosyltransferase
MNILLITNDWLPKKGGITTYLTKVSENLNSNLIIYGPNWADGENLIKSKEKFIFNPNKVFKEVQEIVIEKQIDLILHGSSNPNFLFVNKLTNLQLPNQPRHIKIPQYMICHGAEFNILNYIPLIRTILKRNLNNLNKVFTVSEFSRKKLIDITSTEVINIGAGAEIEEFERDYKIEGALTVGVVSRFVSRKKINWLIDAAHEINQEGYEIKLNILGFGKQENYLKKLAGITSAEVTFFDDLEEEENSNFYKSIDIFAMPSTSKYFGIEYEGLGLVYLEAGSYGMPVIVGASGGSVETILPGRSGFVVSSPKLLKEAILYFINNPQKIEEFGNESKKFVKENYNWEKSIDKLESNFI